MREAFSLIFKVPSLFASGILSSLILSFFTFIFSFQIAELQIFMLVRTILNFFPLILILLLVNTFLTSFIIRATYEIERKNFIWKRCIQKVWKNYLNAFVGFLLYSLLSIFGLILFIIPGIVIMSRLIFYQAIILIENKDVISSFKKSWKVTRIKWRKVLILLLIYIGVWLLLRIIILIPSFLSFLLYLTISILFFPSYFVLITLTYIRMKFTHTSKHQRD